MTAENVALVCPNLFTGDIDTDIRGPRAFAIPIKLMEFLVNNPHTFTSRLCPDVLMNKGRDGQSLFVSYFTEYYSISYSR